MHNTQPACLPGLSKGCCCKYIILVCASNRRRDLAALKGLSKHAVIVIYT